MKNREWGIGNGELGMGNWEWGIVKTAPLIHNLLIIMHLPRKDGKERPTEW